MSQYVQGYEHALKTGDYVKKNFIDCKLQTKIKDLKFIVSIIRVEFKF